MVSMSRYILRYKAPGTKPQQDLMRIRETAGVNILDESPRMLLVEGDEEKIKSLRNQLSDWLVTPEVQISVPDTRYRIKRPIE
jgi:hypothetical protein